MDGEGYGVRGFVSAFPPHTPHTSAGQSKVDALSRMLELTKVRAAVAV